MVWLEEPLGPLSTTTTCARLAAASDVPIAGGENNVGLHEFRRLIERNCYDIIQADAVCSEGLLQLKKVAGYAEMHNKLVRRPPRRQRHRHRRAPATQRVLPQLAVCRAAPGAPAMTDVDFQGLIAEPFLPDADGFVHLPDKPGLGIELAPTRWQRHGATAASADGSESRETGPPRLL